MKIIIDRNDNFFDYIIVTNEDKRYSAITDRTNYPHIVKKIINNKVKKELNNLYETNILIEEK